MNIGCGEHKSFAAMDKHPNGLEVKSSSLEYNNIIIQVNQTKYPIPWTVTQFARLNVRIFQPSNSMEIKFRN